MMKNFVRTNLIVALWMLALGAAPLHAAKDRQYRVAPAPSWITPLKETASKSPEESQQGLGWRTEVIDCQINLSSMEKYRHYVVLLQNESGVQNRSEISVTFDPLYQELIIHAIKVRRGNRVLDRTSTVEIKLIQRETSLERFMYDGRLSALIFLKDIRVGDRIDYAYTIKGWNPIFRGKYMDSYLLQYNEPFDYVRYRVLTPESRKIYIKAHRTDREPRASRHGDMKEYLWEKTDNHSILMDSNLPSWYLAYPWIQISEYSDWNEVARWAVDLYELSPVRDRDVKDKIKAIRSATTVPGEGINEALRFVQDQIRYLGLEMGEHSHKPNPPATVMERRYGDCKDKSLLLTAMLRDLGIAADPALVHTYYRDKIENWLPSPHAFNHVIVQVRLKGEVLWLDPTLSHQRGPVEQLYVPAYGKALVVSEETTDLSPIPPPSGKSHIAMTETYLVENFRDPVRLNVKTTYTGRAAEKMRVYFNMVTQDELDKDYLNYYAQMFTEIETETAVQVTDDESKNILTVTEGYVAKDFWHLESDERVATLYAKLVKDTLVDPVTVVRTMPIGLTYPSHVVQHIHVELPRVFEIKPQNISFKNDAHQFQCIVQSHDSIVDLKYEYQTFRDHANVDEIDAYIRQIETAQDALYYDIKEPLGLDEPGGAGGRPRKINREALILLSLLFVLFTVVGTWCYGRTRAQMRAMQPETATPRPGIRGFLVVLAFWICLFPFVLLRNIYAHFAHILFETGAGEAQHTHSGAELLLGGLMLFLFMYALFLIPCFFGKRDIFPLAKSLFLLCCMGVVLWLHLNRRLCPDIFGGSVYELAGFGAVSLIITLYLSISRQARATFTRPPGRISQRIS
ncbi:DUF3857 domain-containing protein [Acidobacteriota bacterium]